MFFLSFPVLLFLKMPASCGAANCPGQHNLNFVNGSAIVVILEVSQIAKCWREDLRRTCGSSRACPKPVRCDEHAYFDTFMFFLQNVVFKNAVSVKITEGCGHELG